MQQETRSTAARFAARHCAAFHGRNANNAARLRFCSQHRWKTALLPTVKKEKNMSSSRKKMTLLVGALAVGMTAGMTAFADTPALSKSDQAFVAKVSQGGMFEVAASKVAEDKASAQDVKDQANTEVHDHELVGSKLKSIASSNGDDFSTDLNAAFTARVAKLNALSGKAFDDAYIAEMKTIHALDGAAFAQEAKTGENADLKAFAAGTVLIVKRHIGALHGVGKS